MKRNHRQRVVCLAAVVCLMLTGMTAAASSYIYEGKTDRVLSAPDAMACVEVISGTSLGIGSFLEPADLFCNEKGDYYLLDSQNGRVVCLDGKTRKCRFQITGKDDYNFIGAQGLFVTENNSIYICDTDRGRILVYSPTDVDGVYTQPQVCVPTGIPSDTAFQPLKIVVDKTGRMLVVSQGMYEGMVNLTMDGVFLGFVGANRVKPDWLELFWRAISTKAQIEVQEQFVPVEFNNLDMDDEGFLFTTARGETGNDELVRKLNLGGNDVLQSSSESGLGDHVTLDKKGTSYFIDVAAGPDEMFAALDSVRGHVFVYNRYCDLLFVFGGFGTKQGQFYNPSSLIWNKVYNTMAVLDRGTGTLTVVAPTVYGQALLSAAGNESRGDYDLLFDNYHTILACNSNSELAYVGLGKAEHQRGNFEMAMKYFERGNDRAGYSKSYEEYRKDNMRMVIQVIILALLALAILVVIFQIIRYIGNMRRMIADIKTVIKKTQGREDSR